MHLSLHCHASANVDTSKHEASGSSLVDTIDLDEVLQLSLWVDLDALRVQGAAQLGRVLLVIDPMDLRCSEGHNLQDMRLACQGN